ncbi:CMD domain protein [Allopusillimonas ginsengisoli]|uniref:CMD domain protein n=1 Tax=Allopusillimonas ginsengisoli TaxID=453575 RepID=UPI001FD68B50|nr:CMD domain protein [Allopusillimonas ginsengisoli]
MDTTHNALATPGADAGLAERHDVMDEVVGLTPSNPLYAVRHARDKVSAAMQKSYDLFFDPQGKGLTIQERLLVALYACRLSRAQALETHYRQALSTYAQESGAVMAIDADQLDLLSSARLKAMLAFTRKLILKPVEGDQAALAPLQQAGVATPDIVTLAQLIAFLSYQIRVAAGLRALKAMESL